jgi:betaine-aldehyde dehydrogenase
VHEHDRLYIGGEWRAPAGTGVLEVISPSTEEVVGRVPEATTADIDAAVAAARTAFDSGPWARTEPGERAAVLTQLSKLLAGRIDEIAKLISTEAGSPISFSIPAQAFAPTMILDYYANLAATYPFEEVRQGVLGPVVVRREPVGVVAAVIAWNVPLFLTAAKLAPALLAGCTVVLKPAPETPLNAYVFAEACLEAGIPPGVVNVVPAGREVSEYLVRHPGVDKVSFTGSTAAGRTIATICGEQLKRCSLELGGKSAAILLDDVDLAASIPMLVGSGFMNNGEACVAQTRVLAPRGRYAEVVDAVVGAANAMTVGDPLDPATEIGPLITERQRARVESYIVAGSSEGARLVAGGGRPDLAKGWYVEPTVFADVDNGMRIAQEEIFGPVLAVIPYDSEEEALAIANDSDYGLSGTVWSADPAHALDLARQVRTGTMAINHFTLDFAAPFGGFKGSGIGREFGPEGLDQFCELKSISVSPGWTPPGYPAPGA